MRHLKDRLGIAAVLGAVLAAPFTAQAQENAAPSSGAEQRYPSLNIIGFGDLGFSASDEASPSSNSGFFEGQFVLHLTSALSPRFTFFGELSFSARRDAATNASSPGFNAEVERSILKYTHSDQLKLSLGRYHTPLGYWNVAFHHGQWLQTSIARPAMIQFGGQFVPVHFVGAQAEGALPSGGANLSYTLGLGNGRSSVLSRAGDAGDVNNNRALIAGLQLKPNTPFGLQAGGAVYLDKISRGAIQRRERIVAAYAAWTKESPELIVDYARVRHHEIGRGPAFTSHAYYVQAAYRLAAMKARLKPYARWEELRIAAGDAVFDALHSRKGWLAGVRLDPSELVALKAEYNRQRMEGTPWLNGALFQIAFSF